MTLHVLHLKSHFIFDQLQIEEALLRTDTRNWCIINEGSLPAIVMGISGKPEELIKLENTGSIPVIKRFSGGGTVVVDENTLFVTFIFQKDTHDFALFPEPIMRWSEGIYRAAFPIEGFHLKENDYAIGDKKCGGNAQYIKKDRWLHHTSFLWDYEGANMDLLLHPKRTPAYRQDRKHEDFLCKLKDFCKDRDVLVKALKDELAKRYEIKEMSIEDVKGHTEHRRETIVLSV